MTQRTETIHCENWSQESTIDGTVIKNVLLCGNESKNGYPIPPSAFGDEGKTKQLYENKLVYINHVREPDESKVMNRKLEDLGGYIKNVRLVNGKPRGDIQTEGCPKGEITLKLASSRVPNVGMSHVGLYSFNENKELGHYVESVERILSVDVVSNPATTKSFYEQTQEDEEKKQMSDELRAELKTVREERNNFQAESTQFKNEAEQLKQEKADLQKELDGLKQENQELKNKVDEFETAKALHDRKVKIESELSEAKLDLKDETEVSKTFLESLQNEKDENKRKEMIADRVALVKRVKESDSSSGGTTGSRERQTPHNEEWSPEKALESVQLV